MINRNKSFKEIYDLYAIRIIVEKIENCYLALGIVHNVYLPVQDRCGTAPGSLIRSLKQ